jgi:thymidine phosphorylase
MTWLPQETIRIKRDGGTLDASELGRIAQSIADGSLSDAQVGAFAMAVHFRGMAPAECAAFTIAMRDTGEVFDWRGESMRGPVLDKHSTGGVGDLVSLALGPMLAACGAWVPMIVGPGLAHTGGTLDKLESIPGYQSRPTPERFRGALRAAGVAIIGAGDRIAPADRRLYAIRDVTATVDCLALIVASILSKKLASGLDALVLDIKTGGGAVIPEPERGRELARAMISTAAAAGLPVSAFLTDMSEPLARSAGNALEVHEAIAMLRGEACDARLLEVTLALGAEVMVLGGLAKDESTARIAGARGAFSIACIGSRGRALRAYGCESRRTCRYRGKTGCASGGSAGRRRCAGAA